MRNNQKRKQATIKPRQLPRTHNIVQTRRRRRQESQGQSRNGPPVRENYREVGWLREASLRERKRNTTLDGNTYASKELEKQRQTMQMYLA